MGKLLGTLVAYKLIKQLSMPWKEWDAFKLGLIDKDGKTIKKAKTKEEKDAMDYSIRLVKNVKKLVERLPLGKTRLGTLAAALFLLKENLGIKDDIDFDTEILNYINIDTIINENILNNLLFSGKYVSIETNSMYHIKEDTEPYTTYIGIPLYKVVDLKTRKNIIISKEDVRKI